MPNAFKALDDKNISCILLFYNQLWRIKADFEKCHEGQVVTVPQKGDTSDPKKWRGVTLTNIGNRYTAASCVDNYSK